MMHDDGDKGDPGPGESVFTTQLMRKTQAKNKTMAVWIAKGGHSVECIGEWEWVQHDRGVWRTEIRQWHPVHFGSKYGRYDLASTYTVSPSSGSSHQTRVVA